MSFVINKLRRFLKKGQKANCFKIREQDVYLVSYPKSGNTWMRFLLINYIYNKEKKELLYSDLEQFIPSVHKSSIKAINSIKGFRIIKSHFVEFEYPKIVYIVRDGRDALVSYYYYKKDLKGFSGTFEEFYYSELSEDAGIWDEHLRSILAYKEKFPKNIIIVRYEDLKKDAYSTLSAVLKFLGHPIVQSKLEFAINNSSFKELKKMQDVSGVEIEDKSVNFFRKGISNQWKDYFNDNMNEHFVSKSKDLLLMFDYENCN